MTARFEPESWLLPGLAGLLAIVLGVLAGVDPQLAIGGSLALAFVIIVVADLRAGLIVFTFMAFVEIVPFGGPALSATKLLGLLLAISWLAVIGARRNLAVDATVLRPLTYLLAGLLAWILLSTIWSKAPSEALLALSRYALNAMLFVIIVTSVRQRSTALWLIGAFVAGTAVAALYGIASPGRFEADYGRLESASLDPNELAAILVPSFAICLFAAIGMRRAPMVRLAAGGAALLCGATIMLTVSRGGLIALAVALLVAVVVGGRWRLQIMMLVGAIAASVFIYFAGFASPQVVDHLESTTQGSSRVQEGRVTIWEVGWRMVKDNPLQGVGAGNFAAAAVDYVLQPGQTARSDLIVDKPAVAHNTYLETLAELGIVGIALWLSLIAFCLGALFKAYRLFKRLGDETMELLSRGLVAAVAGLLVADFFISDQFSKALWLLLALGPAMLLIAKRADSGGDAASAT